MEYRRQDVGGINRHRCGTVHEGIFDLHDVVRARHGGRGQRFIKRERFRHLRGIDFDVPVGIKNVRAAGKCKLGECLLGHDAFRGRQRNAVMFFGRVVKFLTGLQQLFPVVGLLNTRSSQHIFVIPDAGQPGTHWHARPGGTVFGTDYAQDPVIECVFAYRFNGFANRLAIQQLFLIHDFCVIMADFNHFRQRPGSRERNHLGVVGVFFHRHLFHRDARVLFFKFLDQFRNNRLTLLLY